MATDVSRENEKDGMIMKNYSEDVNRQYHIQVAKGEVGRYVILPGNPKRCVKIAQYFDNPLVEAANEKGFIYHTGVVQSKDSFYGQHEPEAMPAGYELINKWEAWRRMGCLASEMESAALFIVAGKLRARMGSCLLVLANQEREKLGLENPVVHDTDMAIRVAVEAIRRMIKEDQGQVL